MFFAMWSNPQTIDVKYLQGICSPIFVVEDFGRLFAHPSISLIKDSMSA